MTRVLGRDGDDAVDLSPLHSVDDWELSLLERYPPSRATEPPSSYRDFDEPRREGVAEFYALNHRYQTWDFVAEKRNLFLGLDRAAMGVWQALDFLNTLVDDSDPDLGLSQLDHLLQTAEAIRRDGHPDWFVLTGLIHDLGKILCLWGEPQWAVVGDTFPVGCPFDDRIVYSELFADNPDRSDLRFNCGLGVYEKGCGLGKVRMSWGHDEYLYHVLRDTLPEPALYMIRYHSFYSGHREGAYSQLMDDHDRQMLGWVRAFNPYDLYSKSPVAPDLEALRPYYDDLIGRTLPVTLNW